jgi:hypothetical protein
MWQKLIITVLPIIIEKMSPVLREMLEEFATKFYQKSKTTDNPFDDMLAAAILAILEIPTSSK